MVDPERRAYPRGERPPRDDERDFITFTSAEKSSANWPQAFMVAAVFGSLAAIVWAITWVLK